MTAKHEEHRTQNAQPRPQEVESRWLPHVESRERNEDDERYGFLKNLQLRERQLCRADSVRRNHERILEERDSPAYEHGNVPFSVAEGSQMTVPCERHENVGDDEELRGLQENHERDR